MNPLSSLLPESPAIADLESCLIVDRFRLKKRWETLQRRQADWGAEGYQAALLQWQESVRQSMQKFQSRRESGPVMQYDTDLPITDFRQQILDLLSARQTIVVCGETGSGKSTQLPKFCIEAGLANAGMIGHTQPRRIAARSVAARVAEELGTRVGDLVGYKVRFNDQTGNNTLIKLMTDGVLLAETASDRFLEQYQTIIVDEAHERSLNIDFLLGYLHRLRRQRPDLKIIITSATIDADRFAEHFSDDSGPAPILQVSGRTYPVEVRYRPVIEEDDEKGAKPGSDDLERSPIDGILAGVDELISEGPGDILVFLPTERSIRETAKRLRGHLTRHQMNQQIDILPLYARLTEAEQNKIFQPHNRMRIVLATNVAESSLTVPGIRYVIDTGTARFSRYAPKSKVQRLPIEPVAQASADQRAGRCGRLGPGICIRLYERSDYENRARFATPEIRRTNLAAVILQTMMLRLGDIEEFPFIDPPHPEMIRDGYRTLLELGAINEGRSLTDIGRQLGKLPVDPRVGRMIIAGQAEGCLAEILIIAAALETQDVRQRPAEQSEAADRAHRKFADPWSDFLGLIRIWDFYHQLREQLGRNRLQKACRDQFLSFNGLKEWCDIHRQLLETLQEARIPIPKRRLKLETLPETLLADPRDRQNQNRRDSRGSDSSAGNGSEKLKRPARPELYPAIHRALLAGLLSAVAKRNDTTPEEVPNNKHHKGNNRSVSRPSNEFQGAGGITFQLIPGSGLKPFRPLWIVAAEIVETSRRFGRTVAEVDPEWIEPLADHLVKRSYSDPHWSGRIQSPTVYEKVTLFGLPIVVGRRIALATIDPDLSRQILIEKGLVEQQLQSRAKFYRYNVELLEDLKELANRTRSREYIIDPYQIEAFYQQRIPANVVDRKSLEAWDRSLKDSDQESPASPFMKPEDLLRTPHVNVAAEAFPDQIEIGPTKFRLQYNFQPGESTDGVQLDIPQVVLNQVSDERLDWLVPGLLEEKVLAMIRALPKHLRRNLVPAPDKAAQACQLLMKDFGKKPFMTSACQVLSELAEERIVESDFRDSQIPEHLQFCVRVLDDEGEILATGRSLSVIRQSLGEIAAAIPMTASGNDSDDSQWFQPGLKEFPSQGLPESITVQRGGVHVLAFPALLDQGDTVDLILTDQADKAVRLSRRGIMRLFAMQERREIRSQLAHLPGSERVQVLAASVLPPAKYHQVIGDWIIKKAFIEDAPLVRTKEDFDIRRIDRVKRISIAVQEVARILPKMFDAYHELRLTMDRPPFAWKDAIKDIQQQLAGLMPADFLLEYPTVWLAEYPRYLTAIKHRLDRLKTGGLPRDQQLQQTVRRFVDDYQQRIQQENVSLPDLEKLEEYRWMIEEFRVSLFAQQLGTKLSVSEKKLEKYRDSFIAK